MTPKQLYLSIGFATMVASVIMTAYTILVAPFHGFQILIDTNAYGEGLLEAFIVLLSLPAWLILLRRTLILLLKEEVLPRPARAPSRASSRAVAAKRDRTLR